MKNKGATGVTTIWDAPAVSGDVVVVKPADTTENVSAGGTPSAKTFRSFTGDTSAIASYQSVVVNPTGSLSASGSGLGAYTYSGHADGEGYTHLLHAKDASGNILATAVHSIRIAPASGASGGAWEMVKDIDLTDVTTAAAISGSGSISFQSNSDTITVNRTTAGSGTMASMTPTNGQGIVYSQQSGNGTGSLSLLISDVMSTWTREEASKYIYAVQLVITGITYPVANTSIFQYVLNRGSTTVFNSGNAKGWRFIDNNDGANENLKLRANGSTTASVGIQTIRTSKVLTWIILGGELVHGQQDSGTSLPTPAPGASGTFTLGSSSVGSNDTTPVYVTNGLRVTAGCTNATQTLARIAIRRFK